MRWRDLICGAALLLAPVAAAAAPAGLTAGPTPPVGAEITASDGARLGVVDRILLDERGAPRQVLVRPDGAARKVLRLGRDAPAKALPAGSIRRDGDSWRAPLTAAEMNALPAAETPR